MAFNIVKSIIPGEPGEPAQPAMLDEYGEVQVPEVPEREGTPPEYPFELQDESVLNAEIQSVLETDGMKGMHVLYSQAQHNASKVHGLEESMKRIFELDIEGAKLLENEHQYSVWAQYAQSYFLAEVHMISAWEKAIEAGALSSHHKQVQQFAISMASAYNLQKFEKFMKALAEHVLRLQAAEKSERLKSENASKGSGNGKGEGKEMRFALDEKLRQLAPNASGHELAQDMVAISTSEPRQLTVTNMDKAFEKNAGMRTMFHNWLLLHRSTNAEGELWESSEWRQKGAVVMLRAWAHARAEDMLTQYSRFELK